MKKDEALRQQWLTNSKRRDNKRSEGQWTTVGGAVILLFPLLVLAPA
jgi:hypothetical protein